jgi:putative transposase
VTSSTWEKRNLLQSEQSARLLIEVLYSYRAEGKYRIHEFVIMPDHFHLLMTVGPEISIERAVQLIKGAFSYRRSRELGHTSPMWQKGFSEIRVLNSAAFARTSAYIRSNPVRQHLVSAAEQFPYSSANPRFQCDDAPQGLKPLAK